MRMKGYLSSGGWAQRLRRRTSAALALAALCLGSTTHVPGSRVSAQASDAVDVETLQPSRVPNFDVNLTRFVERIPAAAQLRALAALGQALNDSSISARWDRSTGSVDVIYDFAAPTLAGDPESGARSFLESNGALFGLFDLGTLQLKQNVAALGGHLLYFQQTYAGLSVAKGGVGVVLDGAGRVRAVSGPYHANLTVPTTPSLDGAAAVASARADLGRYQAPWVQGVADVLNPALDRLQAQVAVLATPRPRLNVYPTPDGARLAWRFLLWSRNPFGMFKYQIDAVTGEVLAREDMVRYQQALPFTADVFPRYPRITPELKDQGVMCVEHDPALGHEKPCDQIRIQLRNFDPTNVATGVNGTLTGLHAHIENTLADKLPFAQAAKGTWHFAKDDPANFEARTNELDHHGPAAEPAEHQDEIAQFFFINSVIEYIDHLHRAGDARHSRVGQGDFPDSYPNQSSPLVGLVHIPNVLAPPTNPSDPAFVDRLLALDNAFSLSVSEEVAGQEVVVNPTAYGHGFLFNDLAMDFSVPYHEGMHSISSPIAGLEGSPEGGALNEGQADLWAYTAAEDAALGAYVANGFRRRAAIRAAGGDPDLRPYLRHGDSGLSYSELGTSGGSSFEVHRDGEIFAAAMWDIRQLMLMFQTGGSFTRPDPITGAPTVSISLGKETWERLLLGTIYVLGTMSPDTFVRARDAMIVADQALYPSDPLDPDAPGLHRALIEQVYAAREIGVNAAAPVGGRQTISSMVSDFAAGQPAPAAPTGVTVSVASPSSALVTWQPVDGAFAYEILKRDIGRENQRQIAPLPGREYIDGDGTTDGYLHVEYVSGSETSYLDNGKIQGSFASRGISNPVGAEYVVRAIGINQNRQAGVSANSGLSSAPTAVMAVTNRVQIAFSNITFAGGRTEFDARITNTGADTLFMPIAFTITGISNPTVTVANADNRGTGQAGSPAVFFMHPALPAGATSQPRHIVMGNPATQFFTFGVAVTARVVVDPASATPYEPEPPPDTSHLEKKTFTEVFTGIVPASDTGLQLAAGVTYVDVPFTSVDGAIAVTGHLTSPTTGIDLDFELRDANGNVLSESAGGTADETVSAPIQPNRQYVYRVIGWAGVAQDFRIESTQTALVPKTPGGGSGSATSGLAGLLRFAFNPLTGALVRQ